MQTVHEGAISDLPWIRRYGSCHAVLLSAAKLAWGSPTQSLEQVHPCAAIADA